MEGDLWLLSPYQHWKNSPQDQDQCSRKKSPPPPPAAQPHRSSSKYLPSQQSPSSKLSLSQLPLNHSDTCGSKHVTLVLNCTDNSGNGLSCRFITGPTKQWLWFKVFDWSLSDKFRNYGFQKISTSYNFFDLGWDIADCPAMSFMFVCWQIEIQMQISWVGQSTRSDGTSLVLPLR